MHHVPVLLKESLDYLNIKSEGVYFDGTIGFGGHSAKIIERLGENGKLIATDKDESAFNYCKNLFANDARVKLYRTRYNDIDIISKIEFIDGFEGIFVDLGVSSFQLDDKESGFTFREDAPLDLRMDKHSGVPASEVINSLDADELADIFFKYGEERFSRKIARKIALERANKRIVTTFDLRRIIESVIPAQNVTKTLARIFQALRIFVNNELEDLRDFLSKAIKLLNPGGRIVVLTYHSLEDRIVKEFFRYETLDCICPPEIPVCVCDKEQRLKKLTRKPVVPGDDEIKENPRSRSAKLRAAERV